MRRGLRRGLDGCVVVPLAAALALAGCTTTGGSLSRQYGDPNDACATQRAPLIATESELSDSVATGAVVGAAAGALVGLLTSKDNVKGALIGAAAGAALGGGVGYLEGKRKEQQTSEAIVAAIRGDAQADAGRVSKAASMIRALRDCRARELAAIQAQVDSKAITREEAYRRATALEQAVAEDNRLVAEVVQKSSKRRDTYLEAIALERKLDAGALSSAVAEAAGNRKPAPPPPAVAAKVVANTTTNLRSAPTTDAPVVGKLQAGQTAVLLSREGDWAKVEAGGTTAYVANRLVRDEGTAPPPRRPTDAQVLQASLRLPDGQADRLAADMAGSIQLAAAGGELDEEAALMKSLQTQIGLHKSTYKPAGA